MNLSSALLRPSFLQCCFNCGRGGVMPGQIISDDTGNCFCSTECGWSFHEQPLHVQAVLLSTPRALVPAKPPVDHSKKFYQDLALAEKVDRLLLKQLHLSPTYQRAMNALQGKNNEQKNVAKKSSDNLKNSKKRVKLALENIGRENLQEYTASLMLFEGIFGD